MEPHWLRCWTGETLSPSTEAPLRHSLQKNHITPVDTEKLRRNAFDDIIRSVQTELDWLYATRCDRCGKQATTEFTVYSQVFQCTKCLQRVPLFDCVEAEGSTKAGKPKKITVCHTATRRDVSRKSAHEARNSVPFQSYGELPNVSVDATLAIDESWTHNDPSPKKREFFEKDDLAKIKEIESKPIPYWYPPHRMMNVADDRQPWGDKWRAGTSNFPNGC